MAKKKKKGGNKNDGGGWASDADRKTAKAIEDAWAAGNYSAIRKLSDSVGSDADPQLLEVATDFKARTLADPVILGMGAAAIAIVLIVGAVVLT